MPTIYEDIENLERKRFFMMKQRIRMWNALGAYVRRDLGWSPELPDKEREAIRKRAEEMIKNKHPEYLELIEATEGGSKPFEKVEDRCDRDAGKLARRLPVWPAWGVNVRGFGERGLAVIVGETGDLSNYDDFPKVWKRLGLAVFDGVAQGRKNPEGETDWAERGYSPPRRSKMFAYVGDPLMKQEGPYREMYLARKVKEAEREAVDSKMHAHLAAHRYMTKMFIKHLWQAWRRAAAVEGTAGCLSKDLRDRVPST